MEIQYSDETVYPLEASKSGDNAYYIRRCPHIGHCPAYAACLKRIADNDAEKLDSLYADCGAAMRNGGCDAVKMRKEEEAAGHAIYFISRPKLRKFNDFAYDQTHNPDAPGRISREPIKYVPPEAPGFRSERATSATSGDYADAINAALKALPEPVEPPVEKPAIERPAMLPGESPLAYAKRVRELTA